MKWLLFSPDELRLHMPWRLTACFSLWMILALLMLVVVYVAGERFGITGGRLLVLETQLSITLAASVAVFLARRWLDRRSFVSLGLAAEGPWLRDLILGVAVSGLLAAGDFATRAGLGWLRVVDVLWPSQRLTEILTGTLAAFALFLLVSWGEELFFRGYFLQNLSEGLGPRWALLFSSLAFALFHGARVGIDFLLLFAGGVYLAFAVLRSQQLWLATGLHAGWNFFRHAVFGYSLGDPFGGQVFRLVDARTVTPQLFPGVSGGDLMYLLSLAIGAAIVYRYTRKTRGLAAIGDG